MTVDQETQLGTQSFQEVLQQAGPQAVATGPLDAAVQNIARRLEAATSNPEFLAATRLPQQSFNWECKVVRSQEENAFCLPGGKIVVYTGILPIAQRESGLATVLAHEIGHALAHHGAERMAQENISQTLTNGAAQSFGGNDPQSQRVVMSAMGAVGKFGFLLPFSRKHESEADHIGLLLMSAAGYDPQQAIVFWQRMEQTVGRNGQPPEFSSTHPSHEHRVQDLTNWLSQAEPIFAHVNRAPDAALPLGSGN
jgi:predicted Zn-dependent protease